MAGSFLDTSALVKRYHPEVGTRVVDSLFSVPGELLFISRLAVVEVASALSLKVRMGELSASRLSIVHKRFHTDITQGVLAVTRMLVRHYREAERLLLTYSTSQRLRTLDALQMAVALDLWSKHRIDRLIVADEVIFDVATREGLPAVNVIAPTPQGS